MSEKLSCICVFDGHGYFPKWLYEDKFMFSDVAREAFHLSNGHADEFLADFCKRNSAGQMLTICIHNIAHEPSSMHYFCELENMEMLLTSFCSFLDEYHSFECDQDDSNVAKLAQFRASNAWNIQKAKITEHAEAVKQKKFIENLEFTIDAIEQDPDLPRRVKRKRRDLVAPIDALSSLSTLSSAGTVKDMHYYVGEGVLEAPQPTTTARK
jgi:hypothetical protein